MGMMNTLNTLDYSNPKSSFFTDLQKAFVDDNRKRITLWHRVPVIFERFWISITMGKIGRNLSTQQLIVKGLLTSINESIPDFSPEQKAHIRRQLNRLLVGNRKLLVDIQQVIDTDPTNRFPYFRKYENLVSGTIDSLYDSILLIKKSNNLAPIETSDLAKASSQKSYTNLETILNGR